MFCHLGRACDWEKWEKLQLQPGYCDSPPDRRGPVPPAECHSLCLDGENFSCDFQVKLSEELFSILWSGTLFYVLCSGTLFYFFFFLVRNIIFYSFFNLLSISAWEPGSKNGVQRGEWGKSQDGWGWKWNLRWYLEKRKAKGIVQRHE